MMRPVLASSEAAYRAPSAIVLQACPDLLAPVETPMTVTHLVHALDLERTIAEYERRGERISRLRGFSLLSDDLQDEDDDGEGVLVLADDLPLIDAWAKLQVFVSSALFEYDVFQVDVEPSRSTMRLCGEV